MNVQQLFDDDDAVSPVIGVILMVAITVILAAVIATFVLGLGDQVSSTAPQASFSFDYDEGTYHDGSADGDEDGSLEIVHDGGDSIEASELYVRGADQSSEEGDWTSAGDGSYAATEDITAGNTLTVDVSDDDTVRVIYEPDDGGDTATLAKWDGPNA